MIVRAVIFDIGGVLQNVRPMDFTDAWEQRLGIARGRITERTADLWLAGNVGLIDESRLRDGLAERLTISESMVDELLDDMWGQYLGSANTGMVDCLARLRPRYRTGLLSNSFIGARQREEFTYDTPIWSTRSSTHTRSALRNRIRVSMKSLVGVWMSSLLRSCS
jgi:FMN phosphatase YigB (HAD superfamily)